MRKIVILLLLTSLITLVPGCAVKQDGTSAVSDRNETLTDDKSPVLEFGCDPGTVSCKPGDKFDMDVFIKNVSSSDFTYWPFRDSAVLVNGDYRLDPVRRIQNELYYEEPLIIHPGEYDREGCLHDLFTVPDDAPAGVYDLKITIPDASGNIYTGVIKEVCTVNRP